MFRHRLAQRLAPVILLGATAVTWGQPLTVRSRSGQFIVHSPVITLPSLAQPVLTTNRAWIAVQPDPLAVSAERIKQRVLTELNASDQWRGRIHFNILLDMPAGMAPLLTSARFADGWQYSVRVPTRIEAEVLLRGILQALLTEMANRTPGVRPAELPAWLVYGLAAYFASSSGPDLVFETNDLVGKTGDAWAEVKPSVRIDASDRRFAPLRDHLAARLNPAILLRFGDEGLRQLNNHFNTHPALTFNELSLPGPSELGGETAARFRASSELLVVLLLSLPEGPRMLREFVARLTLSLNWQTAFLAAFRPLFATPADVEKWWAVSSAGFSSRDESQTWSTAESLERLGVVLSTPFRFTPSDRAPAETVPLSLERLLREVELQPQLRVLHDKLTQLRFLQARASTDSLELVTGYADLVERYLEQRPKAGRSVAVKGQAEINLPLLMRSTLARLATLEGQRQSAQAALAGPPENRMAADPTSPARPSASTATSPSPP